MGEFVGNFIVGLLLPKKKEEGKGGKGGEEGGEGKKEEGG